MFAFNKRLLLLLVSILAISFSAWCQLTYLKRSTPEAEGLRSKDVLAYIDSLMRQQTTDMHGVMILRNGKVIAEKYNEPFAAEYSHCLLQRAGLHAGAYFLLTHDDSLR